MRKWLGNVGGDFLWFASVWRYPPFLTRQIAKIALFVRNVTISFERLVVAPRVWYTLLKNTVGCVG